MICWRRLREWLAAGMWDRLHLVLIKQLDREGKINWSRTAVDSSSVRAFFGGTKGKGGPTPVDRAKPGSKHHVLTDAGGVPLATSLSAANVHGSQYLFALLAGLPAVLRKKILGLCTDRAYDCETFRQRLQAEGIEAIPGQTQSSSWSWPRPLPLGRRTCDQLAASIPPTAHPLRTP